MQPFETMPSAQNVTLAIAREVFRRDELIARFLADSARYFGLTPPLPKKPDSKFYTRIFKHPQNPEKEKP